MSLPTPPTWRSRPRPPRITSAPSCPKSSSTPAPPRTRSAPRPPAPPSSPEPPYRQSSARKPRTPSSPPRPRIKSESGVPSRSSERFVPVISLAQSPGDSRPAVPSGRREPAGSPATARPTTRTREPATRLSFALLTSTPSLPAPRNSRPRSATPIARTPFKRDYERAALASQVSVDLLEKRRTRLADLDQVAVRIADVAADLGSAVLRRSEELGSP
jgi:hypothetical protein